MLMMLAFLMDQVQELCCSVYKRVRKQIRTYRELWKELQVTFRWFVWESWEVLYETIITKNTVEPSLSVVDTS